MGALFGDPVPEMEDRNAILESWDDTDETDQMLHAIEHDIQPITDELEARLNAYIHEIGLDSE
jgi:hypothetical protein